MATNSHPATPTTNGLPVDALAALLDPAEVEASVERVFNDALYWFPVRHHSPTVARHVETAILERRPKVVFIEGPSETGDLIPVFAPLSKAALKRSNIARKGVRQVCVSLWGRFQSDFPHQRER